MGMIFTITGRGGAGKSTIEKNLLDRFRGVIYKFPSVTTRPTTSFDNQDEYESVLPSVFKTLKEAGLFLWDFEKFGNQYATRKRYVKEFAESDKIGLMVLIPSVIPILKNHIPGKIYSFYILAPDNAELRRRMIMRGSSADEADRRITETHGWDEKALLSTHFDEFVFNVDDDKNALAASEQIIDKIAAILEKQKSAS